MACGSKEFHRMLKDLRAAHWSDRLVAVMNLGNSGNPEVLGPLKKVLRNDKSSEVRKAAAKALGKLGDLMATDALKRAAKWDGSSEVRIEAREALRALDPAYMAESRKKIRKPGKNHNTGQGRKKTRVS